MVYMGQIQEKGNRDKDAEGYIEGKIESPEGLWWRLRIRLNDSYFPGWVGYALRKIGIIKENRYNPNDALDINTTYDENGTPTTTIRPKD